LEAKSFKASKLPTVAASPNGTRMSNVLMVCAEQMISCFLPNYPVAQVCVCVCLCVYKVYSGHKRNGCRDGLGQVVVLSGWML
jgi:hypothetical protein